MKRGIQGHYVVTTTTGEQVRAFVPAGLPPQPAIEWTPQLRVKFDEALMELGRLDSLATFIPDTALFIYAYVRKEAVLSSMIEGTQSSLSDLLLYELEETPGVPLDDVREVSNYMTALDHGLKLLEEGLPLSLRLIKEMHGVLLAKGRGSEATPGEFRRSQNWIGGTRPGNAFFVPPPADSVLECMESLDFFLHDQPEATPLLLKAALAHVQFETIHPFLDGNGRLGRLLITLLLCEGKVLQRPLLYLSLYFKTHRAYYYELLNNVRLNGDWEAWLDFFAEAVIFTARQAIHTAQQLIALTAIDVKKVQGLGRAGVSVYQVYRKLMEHPIVTSAWLVEQTALTPATVNKALRHLIDLGIAQETTAQKRNRVYSYVKYLNILNEGMELPKN